MERWVGGRGRNEWTKSERLWVVIVQARHEQATLNHDSTRRHGWKTRLNTICIVLFCSVRFCPACTVSSSLKRLG